MIDLLKNISRNKRVSMAVLGDSMLPVLRSDDVVSFAPVPYRKLGVNDIVLVKKNGKLLTHRIVYKSGRYAVTRGDNNEVSDGKIPPSSVFGKAVGLVRNNKKLALEEAYNMQALAYSVALQSLVRELNKKQVRYLVLKGLPVYLKYEKRLPRRLWSDCDILVDGRDREKLHRLLRSQGYRLVDTGLPIGRMTGKNSLPEASFIKVVEGVPVVLDIHYRVALTIVHLGSLNELYPQTEVDRLSGLFLQKRAVTKMHNIPYPVLSGEHMVLYLAIHLFQHNFKGPFRFQMLEAAVRKMKDKKGGFANLSRTIAEYRLEAFVYPVFILLKKYYAAPVPEGFLKSIRPHPRTENYIRKHITGSSIFDEEARIKSGITRFRNLFSLSPAAPWRKLLVFVNPGVIYAAGWTVCQKAKFAVLAAVFGIFNLPPKR